MRLEVLRRAVRYRGPEDSTPSPESLNATDVEASDEPAAAAGAPAALPNVLEQDTWDLFRIVLR
jgi:hypothetical protein